MIKVIFFGLGSIGKRHAKLLLDNFNCDLFAFRHSKNIKNNQLGIKEVYSWAEVKKIKPDLAFITNPTFLHIKTALECVKLNMHIFMEKPIDCSKKGLNLLLQELKMRKLSCYVAYNLRFHPVIAFLKKYLHNKKIYHVSVYNSSFLPNWRKNNDHLKSYSALIKQGGGVIWELSHEFDYIDYLFGGIKNFIGEFKKTSSVTIDAEDFLDAIVKTKNSYVNLHLNFFSLHSERSIKVDYEDGFIFADLIKSTIEFTDGKNTIKKRYKADIGETYKKQIEYFLNNINNIRMMNNLRQASVLFNKILEFKHA